MKPSIRQIQAAYAGKGYKFYDKGAYNLNIFGIRKEPGEVNKFDDLIGIIYRPTGIETMRLYKATTDPGTYWLKNPMYPRGTAILAPGQYLNSHRIGTHAPSPPGYQALVQVGNLELIIDHNRDGVLNYESTIRERGSHFGINIHRARPNGESVDVDLWSAGCQVIASSGDFEEFMTICRRASSLYGNSFSYTLFTESEVFG